MCLQLTPKNWCPRRILHTIIQWTDFVSNGVVRSRTDQPLSPVRYYPSTAPVFLWPPLSCWQQSRPILGLFRPAFGVLAKNDDAEPADRGTNLVKDGWGRSALAQFCLATARQRAAAYRSPWRQLMEAATSTWRAPDRERERAKYMYKFNPVSCCMEHVHFDPR